MCTHPADSKKKINKIKTTPKEQALHLPLHRAAEISGLHNLGSISRKALPPGAVSCELTVSWS